ncbi:MAG: prepilin peptidase [Maricaulaceae bacterium]|jgi:prepilin peptidase CpaA
MFVDALTSWAHAAAIVLFPLLMIFAALKDASSMTIPNWIPASLIGVFLLVSWLLIGPGEVAQHLIVGAAVLIACFSMFALNWIGGGDAKLLAAGALWVGWTGLGDFVIWTAIAGGGLSLALILARKIAVMSPIGLGNGPVGRLLTSGGDIPYGLAIAAGGLAAFPKSGLV